MIIFLKISFHTIFNLIFLLQIQTQTSTNLQSKGGKLLSRILFLGRKSGLVLSSSLTSKILFLFYDYIFDQSYELIWKAKCVATIEKERSLNITKYSKKRNYSSSNNFTINSFSNSSVSLPEFKYDHTSLMTKSFIHGRKWSFFPTQ